MKGVQIFMHSVRQVMNNLPAAIRISGVLYLVQVGVGLAVGRGMLAAEMPMAGGGLGLGALVALIVSLITSIWIAVAWHRYVLLAELPAGPVPPFMGERVGSYFVKSILIGLLLMVLMMILGGFGMPLIAGGGGLLTMLLFSFLIQIPMIFLGLRLATALPGTALGAKHTFLAGWAATASEWMPILQLAVIMALGILAFNLIGFFVFGGSIWMAQLWQLLAGWPITMVGLSVLTTLYGHYIEKRPLV